MPWHVEKREDSFCVIKDADGSVTDCHDSRAKAISHIRALYANVPDADATVTPEAYDLQTPEVTENTRDPVDVDLTSGKMIVPWEGILTMEGIESGDSRMFTPNSLTWDTTPEEGMPLMWQKETSHGGSGDKSVRVGSVTQAWREPDPAGRADVFAIKGRGFIDTGNPDGAEAARRMESGTMSGNSVDVDSVKDANVEFVYENPMKGQTVDTYGGGQPVVQDMFKKPILTKYHKGRVRGTTLVEYPAFTEARLKLTNDEVIASAVQEFYYDELWHETQRMNTDEMNEALTAATHVMKLNDLPPREWFDEPKDVTALGAVTITDQGRIYGYVAPANVPHRGFANRQVVAPMKYVDYSRFMSRETVVADGGRVVTGPITMGCGHATTQHNLSAQDASDHYDNSCSIFASVRVGENKHGVWMAGALLPDVEPAQVQRAMQCSLSGDWRPHTDKTGWRELTAALLVPVPGFAMTRTAASVRLENGQLVASSVPMRFAKGDDFVINENIAMHGHHNQASHGNWVKRLKDKLMPETKDVYQKNKEYTKIIENAIDSGQYKKAIKYIKMRQELKEAHFQKMKAEGKAYKDEIIAFNQLNVFERLQSRVSLRVFSTDERKKLASSGSALPDGSYPIVDVASLRDAIQAFGRSNAEDRTRVRAHIIKRARALDAANLIPDNWQNAETAHRIAMTIGVNAKFNPSQPRDGEGQWTKSGGSGFFKKALDKFDELTGASGLFSSLDSAVTAFNNSDKTSADKLKLEKAKEAAYHKIKKAAPKGTTGTEILDQIDYRVNAIIASACIAMHGKHNQDSHGNWADGDVPGDGKRGVIDRLREKHAPLSIKDDRERFNALKKKLATKHVLEVKDANEYRKLKQKFELNKDVYDDEDEGPTRADNERRLAHLKRKLDGDEGLSGSEMKEYDLLKRLSNSNLSREAKVAKLKKLEDMVEDNDDNFSESILKEIDGLRRQLGMKKKWSQSMYDDDDDF